VILEPSTISLLNIGIQSLDLMICLISCMGPYGPSSTTMERKRSMNAAEMELEWRSGFKLGGS